VRASLGTNRLGFVVTPGLFQILRLVEHVRDQLGGLALLTVHTTRRGVVIDEFAVVIRMAELHRDHLLLGPIAVANRIIPSNETDNTGRVEVEVPERKLSGVEE